MARREGRTGLPTLPPAVTVHHLAHAVAALTAAARLDQQIALMSAVAAGSFTGPGFFAAVIRDARAAVPEGRALAMLDCQGAPGRAMAAVHQRAADVIIYTGSHETLLKLAGIAMEHGITMLDHRPPSLDLASVADPEAATHDWLLRR
ncbi:MAG: hypothetical protein EAZ99_02190 [Alphaproteobacteria bacterium]|nr:hypothetical protein [Alphaproteobacteria bacterium]TAD91485.1 MAG: hypothetical protein EAZ99_02190 [Alphaproteobacteria bacterium]